MPYSQEAVIMKKAILCCAIVVFLGPFRLLSAGEPAAENGLTGPMKKYEVTHCTAQLTPTLCRLFDVPTPGICMAGPVPEVVKRAEEAFAGQKLERALVFCPDAIGDRLLKKYPDDFKPLIDNSDLVTRSANVMPSVTPVNFSTIFTGADPATHGRTKYSKDLQTAETLFDVLAKAGKKVAIIAENESSMDKIFRGRPIDYFSTPDRGRAVEIAAMLIERFDYDLIVCYDGGYDSTMHRDGVDAPASLAAMRNSIRRYAQLVEVVDKSWRAYNRLTAFTSDHGSHEGPNGKGIHGQDCEDDCIVNHCYRVRAAER
jgi:predicted AlkP superfamily pyrophosphatase or phosphodiesterase